MKNITNNKFLLITEKLLIIREHGNTHYKKKEFYTITSFMKGTILEFNKGKFVIVRHRLNNWPTFHKINL